MKKILFHVVWGHKSVPGVFLCSGRLLNLYTLIMLAVPAAVFIAHLELIVSCTQRSAPLLEMYLLVGYKGSVYSPAF